MSWIGGENTFIARGMRRRFSCWWICCLLVFAGCRSAEKPGPPKLTVLGLGLQAGAHLREDAIAEYTAKTGVQVDLIPTPGASQEQLPRVIDLLRQRSSSPDIYLIDNTWPGALHEHLLDLTPFLNAGSRRHAKVLLAQNTIGDRLIALPFYMSGGMLFYRNDLLTKYGYAAPPNTWKELTQIASRIQQGERRAGKNSFWGYVWQGGEYEGLTCNALEWLASSGGGRIVEQDGVVSVDNPRAAAAIDSAAAWVGTISPRSVLAYTEADSVNVFRSGNAAFMRHWSSAYQGIRTSLSTGSVSVGLLPGGAGGRAHTIGGFQLAVSRYSLHAREAVELVLYLTGIEVQAKRARLRGFLPTYPELHQQPDLIRALPPVRIFRDAPQESWVFRPASITGGKYSEVSEIFYENVHRTLSGSAGAGQTLSEAAHKLRLLSGVPAGVFKP